jgi:hypothetical protein
MRRIVLTAMILTRSYVESRSFGSTTTAVFAGLAVVARMFMIPIVLSDIHTNSFALIWKLYERADSV